MKKNLYSTLEVDPSASSKDIKKAYLKKARAKHPDKQSGCSSEFQEINHAYQVLSCPIKREHYDKTGEEDIIERGRIIQTILQGCFNIQDQDRVESPIKRLSDLIKNAKISKTTLSGKLIDVEADIVKLTDKSNEFINYYSSIVEMAQYIKSSIARIDTEVKICEDLLIEFESVKKILKRDVKPGDALFFFRSSTTSWK